MKRYTNNCKSGVVVVATVVPRTDLSLRIDMIDIPMGVSGPIIGACKQLAVMFSTGVSEVHIIERYGRWVAHGRADCITFVNRWRMDIRINEILILESVTVTTVLDELATCLRVKEIPFK